MPTDTKTYAECGIRTRYDPPPIPARVGAKFNWSAVTDNYEGGDAIGWGRTEAEAVADLREQLAEQWGAE